MAFFLHNLPALMIVVPLMSAPVCVLLRRRELAFGLAVLITWFAFFCSCLLAWRVMREGFVTYDMGGWPPPIGIEYRIDALNALLLLIVSGIASLVAPYSHRSLLLEYVQDRAYMFYAAFLLCMTGLMGVSITGDAFNLFVFLEISSLSAYVLIALGFDRRALIASYQYLVLGSIGATFIVIAIGLLYQATGTLNMADLAVQLPKHGFDRTVVAAFGFLVVGAAIKIALFPLHQWMPNAYAYAPSTVAAFLAATATKVSVYILIRFMFTIFGVHFSFGTLPTALPLIVLSVMAMFAGSTVACFQQDVKRMLAYSSVAQIGYIVLGVSLVTAPGLQAGIIHLFNHALMKGALFLVMGCVFYRVGSTQIRDFAGLGRAMPWTMAGFVGAGLSLIGVPLTAGFVSKWYLVVAALDKGWWPLAVLIVLSSLLAVIYIWRVIEVAYFQPLPAGRTVSHEAPVSMLIPLWILVAANFYFGIDPRLPVDFAAKAAASLMGSGS